VLDLQQFRFVGTGKGCKEKTAGSEYMSCMEFVLTV